MSGKNYAIGRLGKVGLTTCKVTKRDKRTGKNKKVSRGGIGAVSGHVFRHENDFDVRNSDPLRRADNKVLFGSSSFVKDVQDYAEEHNQKRKDNGQRAMRSDAVVMIDGFLGMSREAKSLNREKWEQDSVSFLKKEYGENLLYAVVHYDETTPHIHFGIKPIIDGVLDAKSYMNKQRLSSLQSNYAEAMSSYGLQRGEKGSKATHSTVKSFYTALANAESGLRVTPQLKQTVKDSKTIIEAANAVFKFSRKVLNAQAVKITMLEATHDDAKQAVASFKKVQKEVKELKEKLSKEDISILREIPVKIVAESTSYTDDIDVRNHKNSIDFLMDTEGFNYNECLTYLVTNFSSEEAIETIKKYVEDNIAPELDIRDAVRAERDSGKIKQSKQEKAITHKITEQLNALGAEEYRVTLMHETNSTFTLNQRKNAEEHLYSKDEIKDPKTVRMLNVKNYKEGRNIFITPISNKHDFFFVDDMTPASLKAVQKEGYTFSTITESSPNNYQGVIKTEKGDYTKTELNAFFRALNNRYGDEKITGQIHPFRLAGFQNMKEKHQQENGLRPFVTIHKAVDVVCDYAKKQLEKLRSSFAAPVNSSVPKSAQNYKPAKLFSGLRKQAIMQEPIKEFKSGSRAVVEPADVTFAAAKYAWIQSEYSKPDIDMSRADIMVARDLAKRGLDNQGIKDVLKNTSPEIAGRHSNLDDYLDRTATKSRFNVVSISEQASVKASNSNNTATKHMRPR